MKQDLASVTEAFLDGWRDSNPHDRRAKLKNVLTEEDRATLLGLDLSIAYALVQSASVSEYKGDVASVARIVRKAREQYGEDFINAALPDMATMPGFEPTPITRYYIEHEGDVKTPAVWLIKWEPGYGPDDIYNWCGGDAWTPRDPIEDLVDGIEVSGPLSWVEVQTFLHEVIRAVPVTSDEGAE